jgi:hypothetical protein
MSAPGQQQPLANDRYGGRQLGSDAISTLLQVFWQLREINRVYAIDIKYPVEQDWSMARLSATWSVRRLRGSRSAS